MSSANVRNIVKNIPYSKNSWLFSIKSKSYFVVIAFHLFNLIQIFHLPTCRDILFSIGTERCFLTSILHYSWGEPVLAYLVPLILAFTGCNRRDQWWTAPRAIWTPPTFHHTTKDLVLSAILDLWHTQNIRFDISPHTFLLRISSPVGRRPTATAVNSGCSSTCRRDSPSHRTTRGSLGISLIPNEFRPRSWWG